VFECFVLVLFEPLKSADPPISSGKFFAISSKKLAEACLEAIFGFKSKNFFFRSSIILSKSLGSLLLVILKNSSFIFLLFLL
jgi:hypothetical protein